MKSHKNILVTSITWITCIHPKIQSKKQTHK